MTATGGLRVVVDHSFESAPPVDLLVVPGGFGTRPLLEDDQVISWLRRMGDESSQVTSVCTGSLLLAKAGLLTGRTASTHWAALDLLGSVDPGVEVEREARVVDHGVITSAGVASGIDMAFYVVEKLFGREVADETARYIEYPRSREGIVVVPPVL